MSIFNQERKITGELGREIKVTGKTSGRVYPIYNDAGESVGWITEQERQARKEIYNKMLNDYYYLFFSPNAIENLKKHDARANKKKDNRKWALIKVGNTPMTVMVDNKTMVAYKMDGYTPTNETWDDYIFIRWARPMDL